MWKLRKRVLGVDEDDELIDGLKEGGVAYGEGQDFVSMSGGTGRVLGCLFGALFLGVINNALPVIGVSPFWQMAISGSVIVIAVLLNERGNKRKGRLILRDAALARQKLAVKP